MAKKKKRSSEIFDMNSVIFRRKCFPSPETWRQVSAYDIANSIWRPFSYKRRCPQLRLGTNTNLRLYQ